MAAAPRGWSGKLPDLATLIGESLSGLLDPTFLIGQSGGSMPTYDVGPWFNDAGGPQSGWWFFDPTMGKYVPSEQGCAIGTIVLWGGDSGNIPANWMLCDSSEVSRFQFAGLFNAIGETWGPGDGESTFNLPPGGVFYINAAGFAAVQQVPLTPLLQADYTTNTNGQGVGAQGGAQQSALIQTSDMPPLQTTLYISWPSFVPFTDSSRQTESDACNLQPQGYGSPSAFQNEPVTDPYGVVLGANQKPVDIMPPFCTICYIIRWQ